MSRIPLLAALAAILLAVGVSALASARSGDRSRSPAGTIAKIEGDKVTIALPNGGGEVTGTASRRTEIECDDDDDRHSGPGPGRGDDDDDRDDGRDDGDRGDRGDDDDDRCAITDLKVGAVVKKADLRLRSGAARWKEIELAR